MKIKEFKNLDDVRTAISWGAVTGEKIASCDVAYYQSRLCELKENLHLSADQLEENLIGKKIIETNATDDGIELYLRDDDGEFFRLLPNGVLEEISYDADKMNDLPF